MYIPSSCGELAASTMKDGWTYAVRSGTGAPGAVNTLWQFPATGFPFTLADGTSHGDTRYLVPGAAWGDTFITMTGGENVVTSVSGGFFRLHALNLRTRRNARVRWLLDIPGAVANAPYQLNQTTRPWHSRRPVLKHRAQPTKGTKAPLEPSLPGFLR